jgi:hypothetical protein
MTTEKSGESSINELAVVANGSEGHNFSIAPFSDNVRDILKNNEGVEKITPIGVIIYSGGREAVFVGDDPMGRIRTSFVKLGGIPDPAGFSGSEGRVLRFDQFDELAVATIDINGVRVKAEDSVRKGRTIKARLSYRRDGSEVEEADYVSEAELIDIFTGKQGGFLLFEEGKLPEETALVIQEKIEGKNAGLVFFFHSEVSSALEINSATGMAAFLNSLNDQWESFLTDKQRQNYLDRLRYASFSKDSTLAREILRSMFIAHLRDFNLSGNVKSAEFVEKLLPRRGLFSTGQDNIDILSVINKVLVQNIPKGRKEVKVDSKIPRTKELKKTPEENMEATISLLSAAETKQLRRTYQTNFGENSSVTTFYIRKLLEWVGSGSIRNVNGIYLQDARVLLQELADSQYSHQWANILFRPINNGYEFAINYDGYMGRSDDYKSMYIREFFVNVLAIADERIFKYKNNIFD